MRCGPGGVRSRAALVPTRGSGTRPHETISEDPELVISRSRDGGPVLAELEECDKILRGGGHGASGSAAYYQS